ncbi:MAG: CDP-alcohol phosphatidyltransferase family protein [Rhodospirillaceae bacterium]|nr:CDP-alcohol phosphatidyltransferase family protein [Rhodospirillaceae bacterium]
MTRATLRAVAIGLLVLVAASGAMVAWTPVNAGFVVGALVCYALSASIIVSRCPVFHPYDSFGMANTVTLIRLVGVCLFAGLGLQMIVDAVALSPALAWLFCALAMMERLLDGIDGYVARKRGMESAFGARFDMEVDALQILLLSVLAALLDKAGAWVLVGGLLRYAFLGAGLLWPAFNAPLPPSSRRKIAAVIQGLTLAALLAPVMVPPISALVAAAALILLVYSFAVDTLWVLRSQAKVEN